MHPDLLSPLRRELRVREFLIGRNGSILADLFMKLVTIRPRLLPPAYRKHRLLSLNLAPDGIVAFVPAFDASRSDTQNCFKMVISVWNARKRSVWVSTFRHVQVAYEAYYHSGKWAKSFDSMHQNVVWSLTSRSGEAR